MPIIEANLALNADNARAICQGVLKSRGMRVTKSFVPSAMSEHVVNINPTERVKMLLSDSQFVYQPEVLKNDVWTSQQKGSRIVKGSLTKVENAFFKALKQLGVCCK